MPWNPPRTNDILHPEQNGVSEHSMRTIIEAERILLGDSQSPGKVLGRSYRCNNLHLHHYYLLKIGKIPYKAFYGKQPNVSNLIPSRSKAYVTIPKETNSWHKLKSKAFRRILTRY
jgi:hypothetical protein